MSERVKAASLVLDMNVYPRHQVADHHVRDMQNAVEAGVVLPPVIADRKSRRVVDGFNRITRALRYEGEGAMIDVVWRTYRSEQDLFLDAIALNSAHGLKFTSYDMARCIVVADELKIDPEMVASNLHITVERLSELKATKTAIGPGSRIVPIKRTLHHLAGERITHQQIEGNRHAVGHHQLFLVNQVINLLESNLLDTENVGLMERVSVLAGLLKPHAAKARKTG